MKKFRVKNLERLWKVNNVKKVLFKRTFLLFMGIINWVIFLKRNTKIFFKTVIISAFCLTVFIGVGYYYLSQNLIKTETEVEQVPFYQESPQNVGLLLDVLGDKTFVYLDFENNKMAVSLFLNESEITDDKIYGYSLDYKINADINFIADFVDYLEGIELTLETETLRYTGVQVADIILSDREKQFKQQIVTAILHRISQNGLGKDIFLEIIEKCETNLTVPDFYHWPDYIKKLAKNTNIIEQ